MDAKTPAASDRQPEDVRAAAESHRNGKNGAPEGVDVIARIERQILALGGQQLDIVKALNALATRLPAPVVSDPLVELVRAVQEKPTDGHAYLALGNRLLQLKEPVKAEAAFRAAASLLPTMPVGFTSLAVALQRQQRFDEAIEAYKTALAVGPLSPARKAFTDLLLDLKRWEEALAFWVAEMKAAPHDPAAPQGAMQALMRADRLAEAAVYANKTAEIAWGTRLWPEIVPEHPTNARAAIHWVKAPKLRHDIEQLEYLVSQGIKADELRPIIEGLKKVLARVAPFGDLHHTTLNQEERVEVGGYYNRIVHMADASRIDEKTLSYKWDMAAIEEEYISKPPGIIHIDDLLSPKALATLRKFCVESTVFQSTNHDNGYLGAYITEGFCPAILVQIAEELRAAMPRVIGKHRLVGMWAYKYDQKMAGINCHADMAAVNVNFWLTPDDANLDPNSGGLLVYDVEAPIEWDFDLYNGNSPGAPEKIQEFLKTSGSREIAVPYKQNRAVIFNSDLFHTTAPLDFKAGYTNRRVNVTLLYGERQDGRADKGQPAPSGLDERPATKV